MISIKTIWKPVLLLLLSLLWRTVDSTGHIAELIKLQKYWGRCNYIHMLNYTVKQTLNIPTVSVLVQGVCAWEAKQHYLKTRRLKKPWKGKLPTVVFRWQRINIYFFWGRYWVCGIAVSVNIHHFAPTLGWIIVYATQVNSQHQTVILFRDNWAKTRRKPSWFCSEVRSKGYPEFE